MNNNQTMTNPNQIDSNQSFPGLRGFSTRSSDSSIRQSVYSVVGSSSKNLPLSSIDSVVGSSSKNLLSGSSVFCIRIDSIEISNNSSNPLLHSLFPHPNTTTNNLLTLSCITCITRITRNSHSSHLPTSSTRSDDSRSKN